MSILHPDAALPNRAETNGRLASPVLFAGATLLLMGGSALLVAWAPVPFAFATFFVLAGPHSDWMEGRYYFLARMPARWAKLRGYYTVALAGAGALSGFAILFAWLSTSAETQAALLTLWNAGVVLWVLVLVQMRRRQNPRREWPWAVQLAGAMLLWNWLAPFEFSIGLAYVHPLMALWILDRELLRRRPEWRRAYQGCLCCLPLLLGWLWWRLANEPAVGAADQCWLDGTDILPGASSRFLVAALAFLVMLHYCVWVVAFPLVAPRGAPWRLREIPLAWRSRSWRIGVACVLTLGAVAVVVMWGCLLVDFKLTRDLYLMASIMSILAEAPFFLRTV